NARLQNLASDPGSPVSGQVWFNSGTTKTLRFYNGTATVVLGTLDQISAPVADVSFNTHKATNLVDPGSAQDAATKNYVDTRTLNQFVAPTADVSFNSHKATNLLDPTTAQDAATKNYVDLAVQGIAWKAPVRVATTASITLSGTQTIDG